MKTTDVSVIIVNFNTKDLTLKCIKSVVTHTQSVSYELIVVDNASTDGSVEKFKSQISKLKNVKLIQSKKNLGFGGGNNLGMARASGRYMLLLNSDTFLSEDSIPKMVRWMDGNPKVGVSTCTLKNPDKSLQATGGSFPTPGRLFLWATFLDDLPGISDLFGSYHPRLQYYKNKHSQDWVTGAFMLIRQEAYKQVGAFDTDFFMYAEDIEYCWRFKAEGWQVCYVPQTSIIHIGSASSKGEGVKFLLGSTGKERSIVGEFMGLKLFYKKHLPHLFWEAAIILKVAALLRFFMFGFLLGQAQARRVYAKAFIA